MSIKIPTYVFFFTLSCLLSSSIVFSAELEPYNKDNDVSYDFSLPDLNGKIHKLADYRGKVVLVNFWASWCLPCLHEMPSMKRLANTLGDKNFKLVTINSSEAIGRIRETLKRLQLDLPVLQDSDSSAIKEWHVRVFPTSYLIDRTGQIKYRVVGPVEWDDADVLLKVKQLVQIQ